MEELILTLVLSIKNFFYQQPENMACEISFRGMSNEEFTEFELHTTGIRLSDDHKRKIDAINFGPPADLANAPFTALDVARNMVTEMNGKFHLTVLNPSEVFVHVLIPRKTTVSKASGEPTHQA